MQEAEKQIQNPQKAADAKEPGLKRPGWGKELEKQFWDLANVKRGRALYATLFTEFDVIPIYTALRAEKTATLNGNSITQPIFDATKSAGANTASTIQSALNSVLPQSGTKAIGAIHGFIQLLGGPAQAGLYITMTAATLADYIFYFVGMTVTVAGIHRYLKKLSKDRKINKEAD
jgi:hypothetical protein